MVQPVSGAATGFTAGRLGDPALAEEEPLDPRRAFDDAAGRPISRDEAAVLVDLELVNLARAAGAVRWTLATVAARLTEESGWSAVGFVRQGDYARERLNGSARTLRELGSTGTRLRELPLLAKALVSGRLSWSHVRALARVARPGDESGWIALAEGVSVQALERAVRARKAPSQRGPQDEEDEVTERVSLACRPETAAKWARLRELSQAAAGETLPAWRSVELVCAEVSSALPGEPDDFPLEPRPEPVAAPTATVAPLLWEGATSGSSIGGLLEGLVCDLGRAGPRELDRRLRRAFLLEQRLDAQIGAWLRIVASRRLHRAFGVESLDAYVRERLGMSPSRARALLQVERCWYSPLVEAFASGRLSWPRAVLLVSLLRGEARSAPCERWLAWAERVSVRRLRIDVDVARALRACRDARWEDPGSLPGRPFPRIEAGTPDADLQTCAASESAGVSFRAPTEVAAFFETTLERVRRQLDPREPTLPRCVAPRVTAATAFDWMLDHALESWTAQDRSLRREQRVFRRDGWLCQFPACGSRRNLHVHHIRFRAHGGGDEEENLLTLCEAHHLRGVHAGGLACEGRAPEGLRFETPVAVYRSGDVIEVDRTSPLAC